MFNFLLIRQVVEEYEGMLKRSIKIEIKKAVFNKMSLVTIIIALVLVLYHAVTVITGYHTFYSLYEAGLSTGNPMITSDSLFCRWLGADVASFSTSAFFFLLPLIAVLPYGWSLVGEMNSGYTKNILYRSSRKTYFLSKYVAGFMSGALAVIIPLVCSVLLLALFVPALKMESIYPYGTIGQRCMWSGIYYEHPFVYCTLYIVLDGIFAGLITSISTALAFFVKSKVAVVLMPFFMMLMMDYMDTHFWKNGEYSPVKFLQALPVQNDCYGWAVFLIGVVFFVITFGTMLHMEKKYEVL